MPLPLGPLAGLLTRALSSSLVRRAATSRIGKAVGRRAFRKGASRKRWKEATPQQKKRRQSIIGQSAKILARVARRPSSAPDRLEKPESFSSQVTRGSNFGDLLSGNKTPGDVRDETNRERREQQKQASAEAMADMWKKLRVPVIGVAAAFAALPKIAEKLGDSLLIAQDRLKEYNGTIAVAFQRLNAERFRRNVEMGQRTAASTASLARAQSRLEKEAAPFNAAMTNVWNKIAEYMAQVATGVLVIVKKIPGAEAALNRLADEEAAKRRAEQLPAQQLMQDIAAGKYGGRKFKPLPPPNGGKP